MEPDTQTVILIVSAIVVFNSVCGVLLARQVEQKKAQMSSMPILALLTLWGFIVLMLVRLVASLLTGGRAPRVRGKGLPEAKWPRATAFRGTRIPLPFGRVDEAIVEYEKHCSQLGKDVEAEGLACGAAAAEAFLSRRSWEGAVKATIDLGCPPEFAGVYAVVVWQKLRRSCIQSLWIGGALVAAAVVAVYAGQFVARHTVGVYLLPIGAFWYGVFRMVSGVYRLRFLPKRPHGDTVTVGAAAISREEM